MVTLRIYVGIHEVLHLNVQNGCCTAARARCSVSTRDYMGQDLQVISSCMRKVRLPSIAMTEKDSTWPPVEQCHENRIAASSTGGDSLADAHLINIKDHHLERWSRK